MSKHKSEYKRWEREGGRLSMYTFENIHPTSIVFDVGMYQGDWSGEISRKYNPTIFGFEPIRTFYKKVCKRFESNPKVRIHNYGLGDKDRTDSITVDRDSSSFFRKGSCTEQVVIRDVALEITASGLKEIDLLALNCEGSEYEILQRLLTTGMISKFKKLFIQFHFIQDGHEALREKLIKEISKTHTQKYCYLSIWELWTKKEE